MVDLSITNRYVLIRIQLVVTTPNGMKLLDVVTVSGVYTSVEYKIYKSNERNEKYFKKR